MTDTTNTTQDTWVEQGQEISTTAELQEYIAGIRAAVSHMHTGLARAAFGALTGQSWLDTPEPARLGADDILRERLEMTVTPAGTTAADATFRQSLAALLAALDAVDRATLTAWLAQTAAQDPHRTA